MLYFSFISIIPTVAVYFMWKKCERERKVINSIGVNNIKMLTVNLDGLVEQPVLPLNNISRKKWIVLSSEEHHNMKISYINNYCPLKSKKLFTTEFIASHKYYASFQNIFLGIYVKNIIDTICVKYATIEIVDAISNNYGETVVDILSDQTIVSKKNIGKKYFNKGLLHGSNINYTLIGPIVDGRFDQNNVVVEKNLTLDNIKIKYHARSKTCGIVLGCLSLCTLALGIAGMINKK